MNIAFLTSGHEPFDDRIFYHMAVSLNNHSNSVEIISSKSVINEVTDGIKLDCFPGDNLTKREKIIQFRLRLSAFKPDVIICSEPLAVLAAKQYSKNESENIRIIYDITEWYPSKKNLVNHKGPARWLKFLKLLFFNIWISKYTNSFIFGEWYKSLPYKFLFPGKPFTYITYYPDIKHIPFLAPKLKKGSLRLSYSGKISLEKGFGNFFNALNELSDLKKDLKIYVKIIGWYEGERDKAECENLIKSCAPNISLKFYDKQNFRTYLDLINDTDIFLDLRSPDFENQHCLPIKLFYYAALGRPSIYSDLKAIRKEVDIFKFGYLVDPTDKEQIANLIINYLDNSPHYYKHCEASRHLAEKNYNWEKTELPFIKFVTKS